MRLKLLPLLCAALLTAQAGAAAADIPALLRAHQYAEADARAAAYADPVARKLVLYEQLLAAGTATPAQITGFLADNPDWPSRTLLEKRRDEALAQETDETAARADCAAAPPHLPAALARCADATKGTDADRAAAFAREAWAGGIDAPGFYDAWKAVLRPQDERARFQRLAAAGSPLAAAQIARLAPAERPAAKALLALRHGAANAYAEYLAAAKSQSPSATLVLAALTWLRRAARNQDALALWHAEGEAAERSVEPARRNAFWAERNALARQLLAVGDNADAEWLADDRNEMGVEAEAASAFLAGFVALRRLDDPAGAAASFHRLASLGTAAITQARAWYWLGCAAAAAGQDSHADYEKAAAHPLTFYGQLALHALGESDAAITARIRALPDPPAPTEVAWSFAGNELVRAAAILASWGEFGRARVFLLRAQQLTSDPRLQALSARLGLALGLPETAVAIARRMGVEGHALPAAGWPAPYPTPSAPPDPAVVLAVVRQESSFDAGVVSPAGARGLMQLMPATAEFEARRSGNDVSPATLTSDPARNMELGAAYLREMLTRYDGFLPLAVAAYNVGPRRVDLWLQENGDPRKGKIGVVDWIELIPFDETRNYVQRVLENVVVYQARLNQPAGKVTTQWMQ